MKKYYFYSIFNFFFIFIKTSNSNLKIKNKYDYAVIENLIKKFKFLLKLETENNSFNVEKNDNNYYYGFSFGIYENPIEYEISSYSLNFLSKKKEIYKSIILGCGAGGFSDISKALFLENELKASFTYNDLDKNLFELFKKRIDKTFVNHFLENAFDLNPSNFKKKFDFISSNNLFNFYNSRNQNSKNLENKNFSIKDFITYTATNLLNKNGILEISNNFIFYLNRKELLQKRCLLSKTEKNKIAKESILKEIFNEIYNLYGEKFEQNLSELLNKENNFYSVSLFPHDIFEENDINFIKFLKEKYSKIIISLPNTSDYIFEKKLILEEFSNDEDLLKNLRENPIILIAKLFSQNLSKEDFYDFLKKECQFGIIFHFEKK